MAYSQQQLRITWQFSVYGTDEIADTGLSVTSTAGWAGAAAAQAEVSTNSVGDSLLGAMSSMCNSIGWADYSILQSVKIAALGTNGKYLVDPWMHELTIPDRGTTRQIPPQSTVVLSLRSNSTLGKGNYGRMYVPHTQPSLEQNAPWMPAASQTAIAGYALTFLNSVMTALNGAATPPLAPAIMGQTGSGTTKNVARVGVGRLVDTQRRRRNRISEEPVFTAY